MLDETTKACLKGTSRRNNDAAGQIWACPKGTGALGLRLCRIFLTYLLGTRQKIRLCLASKSSVQIAKIYLVAALVNKRWGGAVVMSIAIAAWAWAEPEKNLWVSFSAADLENPKAEGFPLKTPAFSNERAVIFQVSPQILPELSHFMHERFGRCGGFFTHETPSQAKIDLTKPISRAGGPYVLDQKTVVEPLMPRVSETELRSVIETLSSHHTRYYQSDTGVSAAHWIQNKWQKLAQNYPNAKAELVGHSGWKQPSVVLTLPGSENSGEVVILGGHLDSIAGFWGGGGKRAPGADDNSSGIAVITEALRVLTEAGWRPKKTVQFMGYSAEEVGLRGSKDIAEEYARKGVKVAGVIQFDMTNFKGSEKSVYLLTDNVNPDLTDFLGKLLDAYVRSPWSVTQCGYGCSDHASWTRSGFPASAAFEAAFDGMNRNLHTEQDTLAVSGGTAQHSVNFAKLAAAFAVELAKTAP